MPISDTLRLRLAWAAVFVGTTMLALPSPASAQSPATRESTKAKPTTAATSEAAPVDPVEATEYVTFGPDGILADRQVSTVGRIAIPASGTNGVANPYPASLVVSGFQGTIGGLSVRLNNLAHTFPADLQIVLVGPGGQKVALLSSNGGGTDSDEAYLTLRDGAPPLPAALVTGTYAPTANTPGSLPAPAPPGPYANSLSVFNGTDPNGTWSLYAYDGAADDAGDLWGFSLIISPRLSNTTVTAIPDSSTIDSQIVVSGVNGPITQVTASLHILHTFDSDLAATLIAPDGTLVPLVTRRGGSGDNFGTSCTAPTTFDDAATTAITAGVAPFAGSFRPESPLTALNGKSGAAVNGAWTLRIQDAAALDVGSLRCWSLNFTTDEPTLEPPTALRVTSIVGNTVTFRWAPPGTGFTPTGYVLEGGVNPGEVLASIPTGSTSPIFSVTVPPGAFYARMRSLNGTTPSANSNEVRFFANVPVVPSPPSNLRVVQNAFSLGLSWTNTFEGGAPANIVLDVTGSVNTSIPLGLVDSFAFNGVPAGTYGLSLRALNAGGLSTSTAESTLTFPSPGCTGAPTAPVRLLVYRSGRTVFATWEPSPTGTATTAYVLNVSGAFVGALPTAGRALGGTVGPGTYDITVTAQNACGLSLPSPTVSITVP